MQSPLYRLENGLRIIHRQWRGTGVEHIGLVADVGSRDEQEEEWGLAHLLEHMLFKGSRKRSARQILTRLEAVGGDLNAYTTRERTCLYASYPQPHLRRAVELLTDIYAEALIPEHELQREKKVIREEIIQYRDDYEERLLDVFEQEMFPGCSMGRPILGSEESLTRLTRNHLLEHKKRYLTTENTVFSYVGPRSLSAVLRTTAPFLLRLPQAAPPPSRVIPPSPQTFRREERMPLSSAHNLMGVRCHPTQHPGRLPLQMLAHLLGGDALSSLLNLRIRERNALVYGIETQYTPYSDCGLLYLYFSCAEDKRHKVLALVGEEFKKLQHTPLSKHAMRTAREQFSGRLVLGEENRQGLMLALGQAVHDHGEVETLAQQLARIRQVTAAELLEEARQLPDIENWCQYVWLPDES
ncbi:MAG: insulinase family protein [Sphingomonadales bacterium]|nr:insulinase family protein [Sphingomonadales bacterium]